MEETELGNCKVCNGTVISISYEIFVDINSRAIIGPGSKNQYVKKTEIYCKDCGVVYKFFNKEGAINVK